MSRRSPETGPAPTDPATGAAAASATPGAAAPAAGPAPVPAAGRAATSSEALAPDTGSATPAADPGLAAASRNSTRATPPPAPDTAPATPRATPAAPAPAPVSPGAAATAGRRPESAAISVAEALSEADLTACQALRHAVFCVEQGVALADERDGRDVEARHLLARDAGGTPLGTLRIRRVADAAKIERVCVAAPARGTGLGAALTRAALALAATLPGVTRAKLGAQVQVIAFYEKLGFIAQGPEYLDAGIPHRDMTRPLP